jgi:hypothetical protein
VRRWRRHGFDRLYGDTADGRCVGWFDLDTGETRIELPALGASFERAVAEWQRSFGMVRPKAASVTRREESRPPAPRVKVATMQEHADLAMNTPGERPRSQAIAIRRREPIWTLVSRLAGVHCDERAWRLGAKGEEIVAKELAGLGSEWRVLHSVPLGDGGADVDHLVIGPPGVFSINAKYHKYATVSVDGDAVLVNGEPRPYVGKSRREARGVSEILSSAASVPIEVQGVVVVVVNAGQLLTHQQPRDVVVVDRRRLRRWLHSGPAVQDGADGTKIFELARRSSAWHS